MSADPYVLDNPHFVKVEPGKRDDEGWQDAATVTFQCRGVRTSKCHQYPDCDCESWDDTHEHPHVPHDECWMEGWFDNDGHSYEGDDADDMQECGVPTNLAAWGQVAVHYEDGYVAWEFES